MENRTLLKSQRNEILALIRNAGLDPLNFEWVDVNSSRSTDAFLHGDAVSKLCYRDSGFYFIYDFQKGSQFAEFSPGRDRLVEKQYPGSWPSQRNYTDIWLSCLKRELTEPDMWAQLADYQLPGPEILDPDEGNEPFTAPQVEQIIVGVQQVRAYLQAEADLSGAQLSNMQSQLEYLVSAAKRQGRKDWFHTAIGVIFSLAVSLSLAPEQAKNIWNILKGTISGIVRLLP